MSHIAISLQDISKRYGATQALSGVTVSVRAGEIRALMGENGAGKSTLLKVLSGAVAPDRGSLEVDGEPVDVRNLTPDAARRLGISIVHQEFSLVPSMTVTENIFLGRELRRRGVLDRRAMERQAADLLKSLHSRVSPGARVESLSVADAQLVEIAKALTGEVRVLALDEPSAVLSGDELETLFRVVQDLAARDVAVLYVSHRLEEVFHLCHTYSVLKDGELTGDGKVGDIDQDELVRLMVGRRMEAIFPPRATAAGEVRLELQDFHVDGLAAPVDLALRSREIVGIAGLQGSGRTRLAKGIFGEVPARGHLVLDGERRTPFKHPADAIAAGVAYLPEDRKAEGLALTKPVRWNATMLRLPHMARRGLLNRSRERDAASRVIERFAIKTAPTGDAPTGSLSGGNQQKVVVGKWLEMEPRVVLFDEPTRGIDIGSKSQIYHLLRELAEDGVAVMIISSELIELLGLVDRIVVMSRGQLVGELPGGRSTEEDVMRLIAGGGDPGAVAEVPA